MAFKSFGEQLSNEQLPWANEYLAKFPEEELKLFDLVEVRISSKGAILTTKKFVGFIYKSNPTYAHLMEFCNSWASVKEPNPLLVVQLVESKSNICLGVEDERKGYLSKRDTGFWQAYSKVADNPEHTNPLPLPVATPNQTSPGTAKGKGTKAKPKTLPEMPLEASTAPANPSEEGKPQEER